MILIIKMEKIGQEYLMYLSTAQSNPIKTLTESLKEVLQDVNIYFNKDGIETVYMDPDQIALVSLKLHAEKFEEFYCPNPLNLGINMLAFHKLLKTIVNGDTLSLFILKNDPERLGINIQNKKKRIDNEIMYNLMDVDLVEIEAPEIDFDSQITMPCTEFQKYCRELSTISKLVTISISNKKIFCMSADGKNFACQKLKIQESDDATVTIDINENVNSENYVIGTFSLYFLSLFCKSSTLCSSLTLSLKAGFPMVITYSVATLGKVTYVLCAQHEIDEDDLRSENAT